MKTKSETIPPALSYLVNLYSENVSNNLESYLDDFSPIRYREDDFFSLNDFIDGIEQFTKIANLAPEARQNFFGKQFLGLHYANDLAKLWNAQSEEKIQPECLNKLVPPDWKINFKGDYSYLVFTGKCLSAGLNSLIKGPTVIECGMFCQLAIWFGIRNVLGDLLFNEIFNATEFYITQYNYTPTSQGQDIGLENLLYKFFDRYDLTKINQVDVAITYVANHKMYRFKHPGGCYSGDNCIVIRNKYTIFDPLEKCTSNLTRDEVNSLLQQKFDEAQNCNDINIIEYWSQQNPESLHSTLGVPYSQLLEATNFLSDKQIDKDFWESDKPINKEVAIGFDCSKFKAWILNAVQSKNIDKSILNISHIGREENRKFSVENQVERELMGFAPSVSALTTKNIFSNQNNKQDQGVQQVGEKKNDGLSSS